MTVSTASFTTTGATKGNRTASTTTKAISATTTTKLDIVRTCFSVAGAGSLTELTATISGATYKTSLTTHIRLNKTTTLTHADGILRSRSLPTPEVVRTGNEEGKTAFGMIVSLKFTMHILSYNPASSIGARVDRCNTGTSAVL